MLGAFNHRKVLTDQDFCRAPVRETGSPRGCRNKKHTTEYVEKELAEANPLFIQGEQKAETD